MVTMKFEHLPKDIIDLLLAGPGFDKRPDPPMGSSILTPYAETGNFPAGELVDYFFVYVDNG